MGLCNAFYPEQPLDLIHSPIRYPIGGHALQYIRARYITFCQHPHDPEASEENGNDTDDGFEGMFRFEKQMKGRRGVEN